MNTTEDDSRAGRPQWQIKLQTGEITKTVQSLVFPDFHFLSESKGVFFLVFFYSPLGTFGFLSNSCWFLDVLERYAPRVISSNLTTEEADFRAEMGEEQRGVGVERID